MGKLWVFEGEDLLTSMLSQSLKISFLQRGFFGWKVFLRESFVLQKNKTKTKILKNPFFNIDS